MRVKIISADGCFKYENIERLTPELYFAIFPRLGMGWIDGSKTMTAKKRRYEYRGKNENNIHTYVEVVE